MNKNMKIASIAAAFAGFGILIALTIGIFLMVVQLGDISVQMWTVGKEVRDLRAKLLEDRIGVTISGPVTITGCTIEQTLADTRAEDPSKDGPCGFDSEIRGFVRSNVSGFIDVGRVGVTGNIDVGRVDVRGSLDVDADVRNRGGFIEIYDVSRP